MDGLFKVIVEKGRFAQWLGLIICGVVAYFGGSGGWLSGEEVVRVVMYGVGLAGGVELMKLLKGSG